MSLSWIRRNRGPLTRWTVFAFALAALGGGLYIVVPPEPRWRIVGDPREFFLLDDAVLGSCCRRGDVFGGPVQLWDPATGGEVARFLTGGDVFRGYGTSQDGRYFVAQFAGAQAGVDHLCWLDLHERREWRVETRIDLPQAQHASFSPEGDFLFMLQQQLGAGDDSLAVVDTATGRVVNRVTIPTLPNGVGWFPSFARGDAGRDHSYIVAMYHGRHAHTRLISPRTGEMTTLEGADLIEVAPDCAVADRRPGHRWILGLGPAQHELALPAGGRAVQGSDLFPQQQAHCLLGIGKGAGRCSRAHLRRSFR